MSRSFFLYGLLLAAAFGGCSNLPPVPSADAPVQQCMVCRHRRDFSCMEVERKPDTPHAAYQGRDYCFCSGSCREEFQRHPGRYAVKGR